MPKESNPSRLKSVDDKVFKNKSPDDVMISLLDIFTEIPPRNVVSGKYYIFVYLAKTRQLMYDQNPFVAVTDVFKWGFRGINFHWNETKQYTWNELAGGLYEIYPSEVNQLKTISFANFRFNS
jgi:hypothetical protein